MERLHLAPASVDAEFAPRSGGELGVGAGEQVGEGRLVECANLARPDTFSGLDTVAVSSPDCAAGDESLPSYPTPPHAASYAIARTVATPPGLFRNCQDGLTWNGRSARKRRAVSNRPRGLDFQIESLPM